MVWKNVLMWQRPSFMEFEALFSGKALKRSPMDGGNNIQSSTLSTWCYIFLESNWLTQTSLNALSIVKVTIWLSLPTPVNRTAR
jgi:hypothetical protein